MMDPQMMASWGHGSNDKNHNNNNKIAYIHHLYSNKSQARYKLLIFAFPDDKTKV